jgi:chromosome partitioning protein
MMLARGFGARDEATRAGVDSMMVLTFFNHAGGVAKTSTVRDVGYVLAEGGHRVLLIDMDPQANLTKWLGFDDDIDLDQTVYPAIMGEPPEDDAAGGVEEQELRLPSPVRVHGMDLIPAHLNIAIIEREILSVFLGVLRLRDAVRKLDGYDFVLIDPPPSLGQLSALAVVASDRVVVPLPTNRKGLDGIPTVVKMVREYKKAARDLSIALFVLTQHDRRTRHDRESHEIIAAQLPSLAPISSPLASRPAIYSDAQVEGLPIPLYAPGSEADREVRRVTQELLVALGRSV